MNTNLNTSTNQNNSNETYQSFSISFTEPWLFDTPNLVGGSYFFTARGQGQYSYLPFDTQQQGGTLRWGRRFKWPDHYFRGSWMIKWSNNIYIAEDTTYFNTGFSGFSMDNIEILEKNGLGLNLTFEVIDGIKALGVRYGVSASDVVYFTHGTTIGVNTVIQRKGIRLGLLVTRNFTDVLELARLKMPDMYSLLSVRPEALVAS